METLKDSDLKAIEPVLKLLKEKYGWNNHQLLTSTGQQLVFDTLCAFKEINGSDINDWVAAPKPRKRDKEGFIKRIRESLAKKK